MTRFRSELRGDFGEYWRQNALKDIEKIKQDYLSGKLVVKYGVARWKSNNSVIPEDCLEMLVESGVAKNLDVERTKRVRERETKKFLCEYKKKRENYVPSAEERYEMEAAFGKGTEVVDIITGKKIRL